MRLNDLWAISGPPGRSFELQNSFFSDLGYHFEGRRSPDAFVLDFWSDRAPSNMKTMQKKIKVLLNNVKVAFGKAPDLIFIDFSPF